MALKGQWTVSCGLVPGEPNPTLTKVWSYTSEDLEADKSKGPDELTEFSNSATEAYQYALSLTNPAMINWVTAEFMWI